MMPSGDRGTARHISFRQLLALFIMFFGCGVTVRLPALYQAFYLNEDAALILAAERLYETGKLSHLFVKGYGPSIIRPFQILGFLVENGILGFTPAQSILSGLILLALAQVLLFVFFWKHTGNYWSVAGIALLGVGPIPAEVSLWLSDRHDLYLLLFAAAALLVADRIYASGNRKWLCLLPLYSIFLWCAFWSNEKSLTFPVLIPAGLFLLRGDIVRAALRLVLPGTLLLAGYFFYRYSVLGTLVGGYHDSILPTGRDTFSLLARLLANSVGVIFWTGSYLEFLPLATIFCSLVLIASGLLKTLPTGRREKATWLVYTAGMASLILVSAAPTMRITSLMRFGGQLNTRLLWPQWLVSCIGLAMLFGLSQQFSKISRILVRSGAILLLATYAALGYQASSGYARAYRMTRKAVDDGARVCSCVHPKQHVATGLPVAFQGANTFTEPGWYRAMLQLAFDLPECPPTHTSCSLHFSRCKRGRCDVAVQQTDETYLKQSVPVDIQPWHKDRLHFELFPSEAIPESETLWQRGVTFHRQRGPFDAILVLRNDKPIWKSPTGLRVHDIQVPFRSKRVGFRVPSSVMKACDNAPCSLRVIGMIDESAWELFPQETTP